MSPAIDPRDGSFYSGLSRWTRDGKLLWSYPLVEEWHASL